jgi:hypothetical protein
MDRREPGECSELNFEQYHCVKSEERQRRENKVEEN